MDDPHTGLDPVDAIIEEFLARRRRGERPSVEEFAACYPERADELRSVLPALALVEDLKTDAGESSTGPGRRADPPSVASPARLGDYQVIREIGRGGMGVVFEAEQVSLGRLVALKVLPAPWLCDARRVQRFEREARAAARLHHTNIVPVFGVGRDDGHLYYVMQLIRGRGLDEVLDELRRLRRGDPAAGGQGRRDEPEKGGDVPTADVARSLLSGRCDAAADDAGAISPTAVLTDTPPTGPVPGDPATVAPTAGSDRAPETSTLADGDRQLARNVAKLGIQVAEALEYAHRQGVLHRDIKPSNLLLDASGNVWVTDFGLAKATDSADLTLSGDLVGTLRYMAPERFRGVADARSDVYSLGLTLYELLAMRPAFDELDRSCLIRQVTLEEPPRLRSLDRSAPPDLETIIHKAMARDPAGRYATAGALAEDLKRFVDGRPILARRVGAGERAWRWCRRNPAVAGLGAASVLLLVALAVGSIAAALWMRRQRDLLVDARDRAEQSERARKLELVDALLRVAPDGFPVLIDTLAGSRDLARPALRRRFDDPGASPRARLRAAMALTILGDGRADFLREGVLTAPAAESRNLGRALAAIKSVVVRPLEEQARAERDPAARARLASALLQLGEPAAARRALALRPDPVDRVTLIHMFPEIHGNTAALPALLRADGDPAFVSGLCLALAGVEPAELGADERAELTSALLDRLRAAPDGATHSAAAYALRRWGVDLPSIPASAGPAPGRGWFVCASGLTMIEVPPGVFPMGGDGSEQPPTPVVMPRPFFLSDREVPAGLFRRFLAESAGRNEIEPGHGPATDTTDDEPVTFVSWTDAILFCNWLSRREGRRPAYVRSGPGTLDWTFDRASEGFRLPTHAESEYALRADTTTRFITGEEPDWLAHYGNIDRMRPEPGGRRMPNDYGLFDMLGNVWERSFDRVPTDLPLVPIEPVGPIDGETRAMSGGAFGAGGYYARSAVTHENDAFERGQSLGFRVACAARRRDAGVPASPHPWARRWEQMLGRIGPGSGDDADSAREAGIRAFILEEIGRRDDAQSFLDQLARNAKGNVWPLRVVLFHQLGWHHWREAGAVYQQLVALSADERVSPYEEAALLAAAGDREAYLRLRSRVLHESGMTNDAWAAERLSKAALLLATGDAEQEAACRLADRAISLAAGEWVYPWALLSQALADARRGRYAEAIGRADEARAARPAAWNRDVPALAIRALALDGLGRIDEARAALADAVRRDHEAAVTPGGYDVENDWHDRAIADVLLREVELRLLDRSFPANPFVH